MSLEKTIWLKSPRGDERSEEIEEVDEIIWLDNGALDSPPLAEDSPPLAEDSPPLAEASRENEQIETNAAEESVPGVPKRWQYDDRKRFSFGVSDWQREKLEKSLAEHLEEMQPSTSMREGRQSLTQCERPVEDSRNEKGCASLPSSPIKKQPQNRKKTKAAKVEEDFFGVYCLISRSQLKQYKNRCYIGYTVDPSRRIRQHNRGKEGGGAKKTDSRGPWDMVCIVHGFPNSISALRFEWAWQNPDKSRVLRSQTLKKNRKETPFAYRLRIACHLITSDPWRRLALTFQWLNLSEKIPFPSEAQPPQHMRMAHGLVEKSVREVPADREGCQERGSCVICKQSIQKLAELVRCQSFVCPLSHFHMTCIAIHELTAKTQEDTVDTVLFPLTVRCPVCRVSMLWGDIIRDQRNFLRVDAAQKDEELRGLLSSVRAMTSED